MRYENYINQLTNQILIILYSNIKLQYQKVLENIRKCQKILDDTDVVLVIKFYWLVNFYNFCI